MVHKQQVHKEGEQRTGGWSQIMSIPGHGLKEAEHLLGPIRAKALSLRRRRGRPNAVGHLSLNLKPQDQGEKEP